MATSNSVDFKSTKQEMIADAATLVKITRPGEDLSGEDYTFASRTLNRLLKSFQAKGLNLFAKSEVVIFLKSNNRKYSLSAAGDHACLVSDLVETEIGADEALGQTVITVDSTAGMSASDYVGIEQDDNTIHWSTIVSVDDLTTITIAEATTAAATSNNNVYTYTNRINRPMDILSIRYKNDYNNETALNKDARQDYFDRSNKLSLGQANYFYYDPQNDAGELYVYPISTDMSGYLRATVVRVLEDVDNGADNFDFPTEWELAIQLNLAVLLGRALGKTEEALALKEEANLALQEARMWDNEHASLYLIPRQYGR